MRFITGRPMQMPGVIDLRNADVHIASDALIAYCEKPHKGSAECQRGELSRVGRLHQKVDTQSSQVNGS